MKGCANSASEIFSVKVTKEMKQKVGAHRILGPKCSKPLLTIDISFICNVSMSLPLSDIFSPRNLFLL